MVLLGSSAREEPPEHLEAFRPIADEVARHGFSGDLVDTTTQIMFGRTFRNDPDRVGDLARFEPTSLPSRQGWRTPSTA